VSPTLSPTRWVTGVFPVNKIRFISYIHLATRLYYRNYFKNRKLRKICGSRKKN